METLNDQQCLLSCLYDYTSPLAAQENNTFLECILEYKEYNVFPSLNIFKKMSLHDHTLVSA